MKVSKLLVLGVMAATMCFAGLAIADRIPATCSANNLWLDLDKSTTTIKNGQTIYYTVEVGNENGTGCLIDEVLVTIQLPAADGTPTGTIVTLDSAVSLPVDGSGNTLYPPVAYIVAVNPGVVDIVAEAKASGVLHDAPTNHTAAITKTVGTTVVWPGTDVGISADPTYGYLPYDTYLEVTEENTGDDPLTDIEVEIVSSVNGYLGSVYAPPDSGDTGLDGILGVGETWTWSGFGPITVYGFETFEAYGYGTDSTGSVVSYSNGYPGEMASTDVDGEYLQPEIEVTKSVSCDVSTAGEEVTYHICIRNIGPVMVFPTVIDDTVLGDLLPDFKAGCFGGEVPLYLLVGEECCLDFPYVIQPGDLPGPLVNVVTFEAEDEIGQDASDYDDATVELVTPSLIVTKSCTSPNQIVEKGGVAMFEIYLENNGDVCLDVEIDDLDVPGLICGPFKLLPGDSQTCQVEIDVPADTTAVEIINRIEATWTICYPPATENPPCLDNITGMEPAEASCDVAGGATRTPGFWKTHTTFAEHVLLTHCVGVIDLGFVELDTIDEVCAYFWANKANNTDGSTRSKLCQARMHAAFHAIAANLNNCVPSGGGIPVSPADIATILGGTNIKDIQDLASTLAEYNESGDDVMLNDPDAEIGSATPSECKDLNNLAIADCLVDSKPKPGKGPK